MNIMVRRLLLVVLAIVAVAVIAWVAGSGDRHLGRDGRERVSLRPTLELGTPAPPTGLPLTIDPAWQVSIAPLPALSTIEPDPLRIPARRDIDVLEASALYRRQIDQAVAEQWGINGSSARLAAQLHKESAFRVRARSSVGAQGLAQFMPATARWIAAQYPNELGQFDPWDSAQAIRAAAIYDKHLLAGSDAATDCDRWGMAFSKYNGGERHFERERRAAEAAGDDPLLWFGGIDSHRTRGLSQWRENRDYVRRILVDLEPAYIDAGWDGVAVCVRPAGDA